MIREALKSLACVIASLCFGALTWWLAVAFDCSPDHSAEALALTFLGLVAFVAAVASLIAAFVCADAAGRATA